MFTDRDLNEVQRQTELALLEMLHGADSTLEGRFIYTGFDDATIHAHVRGTSVEVWIYPEGASYGRGRVKQQRMFELLDFAGDQDALRSAFVKAISVELAAARERPVSRGIGEWLRGLFGGRRS